MPTRLLVALTAGVVTALAFEPVTWAWLMPVGLAAFFLACRGATPIRAAAAGAAYGAGFFGLHLIWMREALGTSPWVAISLAQAAFLALLGAILAALGHTRPWPLWYAVAWLAVETVRGTLPLGGFTWGSLGFGVIDTPVAAWLPWIGVPGASLVVAGLGAALAWLLAEGHGRTGVLTVAGAVVLLAVPAWLQPPRHQDGTTTIALVQGDVPGDGTRIADFHYRVTRSHANLTMALARQVEAGDVRRPDFVVWPENSTAVDPYRDPRIQEDVVRAVAAIATPVLIGAISDDPHDTRRVINQGIVVDPLTGPGEHYVKAHPVPFGEFVPWRGVFGTRFTEDLGLVRRDMVAGTREDPLTIAGTKVADAICFDVAFDDTLNTQVRKGARLALVQTSNATFINTRQIDQQFAITRVRARELGRTLAVASANGRTGIIDADGDVVTTAQTRTRDVLLRTVPLYDSRPPSLWVGPVLGPVAVLSTLVGLAFRLRAYRRSRGRTR